MKQGGDLSYVEEGPCEACYCLEVLHQELIDFIILATACHTGIMSINIQRIPQEN